MLMTLIRRELLDNLMTFRFAAAVFITLLLVVTNTVVLLKDYEQRPHRLQHRLSRKVTRNYASKKPIPVTRIDYLSIVRRIR